MSGAGASGGHPPEGPPQDSDDDAPSELLAPLLEEWAPGCVEVASGAGLRVGREYVCGRRSLRAGTWRFCSGFGSITVRGTRGTRRAGRRSGRAPVLEVLKWAREHGCPWDKDDEDDGDYTMKCCACAAAGGHLQLLKWARAHGCPWEEDLEGSIRNCCAFAAFGGQLEVLKWLREQNCPWDAETCVAAAHGGHLEVLKWARDETACEFAAGSGHLEVLKWAREHNCP